MANVTDAPHGTMTLDTAATIFATGTKVRIKGYSFTGALTAVGELQNGAGKTIIKITAGSGTSALWFRDPIVANGLIVAAGITGTFNLFVG